MSTAKRLLLIAFHCPPFQGSTGVTRTLSFAKYLQEYGWEVTLLTATPGAYSEVRAENLAQIPKHVRVARARALDAQRHFSLFGRYPWWLASPDRWRSWYWPAVLRGVALHKLWRPHAVMSTYPIATAHQIGATIARVCGLPWIADFRDPMAQENYPTDPRIHRAFEQIERKVFASASRVLVTTAGAAQLYASRFPHYPRERIVLIPNGFDAEMFPTPAAESVSRTHDGTRPLNLLHSGLLYPSERDPTQFFQALSELRAAGRLMPQQVQFNFRAAGHEGAYRPKLLELGLQDWVHLLPPIPYDRALAEMTAADGFLLFQASNCNDQIPAKLYEYLYTQKPILGLTDFQGETARLMQSLGSTCIANLHDKESIKQALPAFVEKVRNAGAPIPPLSHVAQYSRRNLTGALAGQLNQLIEAPRG